MKIGENEISEEALVEALKRSGKRVVELTDYEGKASAANDLSKLRSLIGDDRPVDKLAEAIKSLKAKEDATKTKEELLELKVKELSKAVEERDKFVNEAKKVAKQQYVKDKMNALMAKENVKVIDSIMEKHRSKFYDADLTQLTEDQFVAQAEEAVRNAFKEQQQELGNIGIKVDAPNVTPSFSDGGMRGSDGLTPTGGGAVGVFEILKQTSSSSGIGAALGILPKK
jgi:hypothetical protein